MAERKHILMICGSLRAASMNRQMGEVARDLIGDRAETHWLDYADLPPMNQDIEFPTPEQVQRVRDEVKAADGLWIFSPEYNHNIPGPLKNCLDWLSRPVTEGSAETVVKAKSVTHCNAAGSSAGRYSSAALLETLSILGVDDFTPLHSAVRFTKDDYVTDKLTMDEAELGALRAQVEGFLAHLGC